MKLSTDDISLPKLGSLIVKTESSTIKNEPKNAVYKSYIKFNQYPKIKVKNNKREIYKTLDIIHKLSLENKAEEVYNEEMNMKLKREKIDSNKEIKEKRLGIFKKKDPELIEDKVLENKINIINEKLLEKYGMKEKEKKTEKKYNNNLKEIEKMEKDIEEMTTEIKELVNKVDNNKLEINVIDQYGERIDKKQINSEEPIKPVEKKQSSRVLEIFKKNDFSRRRASVVKITDVAKECKIIVKKYQRDEKQKIIRTKVNADLDRLVSLQKNYQELQEKFMNIKKETFYLKKELVNIYHITLYEGLDFRKYGLASYILNIWNLGMNVDVNFFPTYLDKISVDYLFDKAKKIIEKGKLRKLIEETELDYIDTYNRWKEDEIIMDKCNNNIGNFFKTKILEKDSFYQHYPKTKIFMMNYNKKHDNESSKVGNIKVNNISFKKINIPITISEKNKKKEKLKYLIKLHQNQMDNDEKNEILRIAKEFLYNDYEKKYQVCIETIVGALSCEEKRDEYLNIFYKLKKEYKDNLKKIEFFCKFKTNIPK